MSDHDVRQQLPDREGAQRSAERKMTERPNAADEPLRFGPHGAPQAPDPQEGMLDHDEERDPESARTTRPATGEPFGP